MSDTEQPPDAVDPVHVLVVDDEEPVLEHLCRVLRRHPLVRAYPAGSVEQALAFLARHTPDAAWIDLALGDDWGHDVISSLRRQAPHAVIHAISGRHVSIRDGLTAKDAGADLFIEKPFDSPKLVQLLVRQVLEQRARSDVFILAGGAIRFEVAERAIVVDGKVHRLRDQSFQLLVTLFRARGARVSNDCLMERIWSERAETPVEKLSRDKLYSLVRRVREHIFGEKYAHLLETGSDGYRIRWQE